MLPLTFGLEIFRKVIQNLFQFSEKYACFWYSLLAMFMSVWGMIIIMNNDGSRLVLNYFTYIPPATFWEKWKLLNFLLLRSHEAHQNLKHACSILSAAFLNLKRQKNGQVKTSKNKATDKQFNNINYNIWQIGLKLPWM